MAVPLSTAPFASSVCADAARFARVAGCLARRCDADVLLPGGSGPAWSAGWAAFAPTDELEVTAATTPDDLKHFAFDKPGLVLGFLGYGFGLHLRGVRSVRSTRERLGHLRRYAASVRFDPVAGRLEWSADEPALAAEVQRALAQADQRTGPLGPPLQGPTGPVTASLGREAYEAAVAETLAHIRAGDVYQLNLSTLLRMPVPAVDPAALFQHLTRQRPAGFQALYRPPGMAVVSSSPERFLQVRDGRVLTQPIKGTLAFERFAAGLVERLRDSPKEDAELSMIVDLLRNDLSPHCTYGSVKVERHKAWFRVGHLLHLYSDVVGELRPDRDALDLLLDALPGGSVTGCPKSTALELIDALEPHDRGVYCGTVLALRGPRELDSSVAIRTAVWHEDRRELSYGAGSGIVVDSDPAREYLETMAKARPFLQWAKR